MKCVIFFCLFLGEQKYIICLEDVTVSNIVYNVNIFFNEFDEVVMCLEGSMLRDLHQGPQNSSL
jgi:hypothetical protein